MKTAPMGWNSWDCYGAAVTEETVRKNAEYMAAELKQYGWEYIVVDIQWYEAKAENNEYHPFTELCMDEYSRLQPAPNRFPSSAGGKGFALLAEYVHSLGLKFGIHIMRGIPRQAVHDDMKIMGGYTARQIAKTASICAWNTDMYGVDPKKEGARAYYDSLFTMYADWGVDFIKCDDICRELPHEEEELKLLSSCLRNCGREMVLSLSPGAAILEKAELYKQVADMWRITDDFWDQWELLYAMFERAEKWAQHAGAGHWPDADMLPVGPIRQVYGKENRTKFTQEEQLTMMTLWCILRSPLMIGGEMTGFDGFTKGLLTNREILRMHRNARHSHQVWRRDDIVLWIAVDAEGGHYVAIFNLTDREKEICIPLEELELEGKHTIRELWSDECETGVNELGGSLPMHGTKVWHIR